jgi:hypothetical protein
VYNSSTGLITVSGDALVTSANASTSTSYGTIYLANAGTATDVRLNITGGTVENTATGNGTAVYNASTGTVTISGGTISATTGTAVYNYSTGTVTISGGTVSATTGNAVYNGSTGLITVSGDAVVTSANTSSPYGTIHLASSGTSVRLNITGGTVENTATSSIGIAVYNYSTGAITISGGTVSATTGYAVYNYSTGAITISGGTISATTGHAVFNGSTGAVTISGGTVSATTGYAVYNYSTGTVIISGGTVSGPSRAVYNNSTGTIALRGNPAITGSIHRVDAAAVLNLTGTSTFAPESDRVYTLSYDTYTAGTVAVTGGASFLSNFALDDSSYKLEVSGSNLVVAAN